MGLDGVGDADGAKQAGLRRKVRDPHDRAAFGFPRRDTLFKNAGVHAALSHQAAVADGERTPPDIRHKPAPHMRGEGVEMEQGIADPVTRKNGVGEWMFATLLRACRQPQEVAFCNRRQRDNVGDDRLSLGQRAGFIRTEHRHRTQGFHRRQVADDGAAPRHALHAYGKRDGKNRRQAFGDRRHRQANHRHQRIGE